VKDEAAGKLGLYCGEPLIGPNLTTDKPHPLQSPEFKWPEDLVYVRRDGEDTGSCTAAVCPYGLSPELTRLVKGATRRQETALVIVELGATPGIPHSFSAPDAPGGVVAESLPWGVFPELAEELNPEDKDLALRIRANEEIHWSALSPQSHEVGATFQPLLIDSLGKAVVALWIPTRSDKQRWYVIPPGCRWEPIIDWLVYKAIPAYVPNAANRVHELAAIEAAFRTEHERTAMGALETFEEETKVERTRLEAALQSAEKAAGSIRIPLLYESGASLKSAVEKVLHSCGFDVEDLDKYFGDPLSSDLLASLGGKHWLIETKAAGGHPAEDEVSSVVKHVRTWQELGRPEKLEHAVLVMNHNYKRPAAARPPAPYSRKEFVNSLPNFGVSVIGTMALCRWWATQDCEGLTDAVTGPIGQYT
jgi:hypothetical protein